MNLQIVGELIGRAALLGDPLVAIWADADGKVAAEVEALKTAGKVSPHTEIMLVREPPTAVIRT